LKLPSPDDGEGCSDKDIDWADLFSEFVYHTSIDHEGVLDLTLPIINAYRRQSGKHIELKLGLPSSLGLSQVQSSTSDLQPIANPEKPPKLSQFIEFANAFNGVS
jgi:hypothetical protein